MSESRRQRRTKADIDRAIDSAAEKLIGEKGFANVQLTDITREAEIEPLVFYNRYANLEEFFYEFVKKYDYWASEKIGAQTSLEPTAENLSMILDGLIDELTNDTIMREVLRWEISEGNTITERMAMLREMLNMQLVFKYKKLFREKKSPIDIAAFGALIIGGVYYLFLHRNRSSFCGLDFNDPADITRLRETIARLSEMVFKSLDT